MSQRLDPLGSAGLVRLNIGCGDCPNASYYNVDRDPLGCLLGEGVDLTAFRFIQAEAHDLPVADASVDVVYASHVLEHLPVLEAPAGVATAGDALREWHRVLKPGGSLFVAVPDFRVIAEQCLVGGRHADRWMLNLFGQPRPGMAHCWAYTADSLREALGRHGFQVAGAFDCFMFKPDGCHDASGGVALNNIGLAVPISLNLQAVKRSDEALPCRSED